MSSWQQMRWSKDLKQNQQQGDKYVSILSSLHTAAVFLVKDSNFPLRNQDRQQSKTWVYPGCDGLARVTRNKRPLASGKQQIQKLVLLTKM